MPRRLRHIPGGQPVHVVQRGNNRAATFFGPDDYQHFRTCLLESCARFGCAIHAYVFMTNHVHLLLTPTSKTALARVMQAVGRRYVRRFNETYGRTGTLWEGRYRASLIDTERYLFTCHRYIELNPLRAGLAARAAEYPWSSHRANALGVHDPLVMPHDQYVALGVDQASRCEAYRALFTPALDAHTLDAIRAATWRGWPIGGERFRATLAALAAPPDRRAPRRSKRL